MHLTPIMHDYVVKPTPDSNQQIITTMLLKLSSVTFAASLLTLSASAQNLILNGDFEAAGSWTPNTGGVVVQDAALPAAGSFSASMTAAGAGAFFIDTGVVGGVITGGNDYNLSFDARTLTTDFTEAQFFYQVQWFDAGNGFLGEQLRSVLTDVPALVTSSTGNAITDSYTTFSETLTAPASAAGYLVRFQLAAGPNTNNTYYVDNASLTSAVIPEPSAFSLFAGVMVLMIGVAGRRNRA
jgi:hypothetical protein